MAMEVAGTSLNWSPAYRGPLSAKTIAHAISLLLHTPSSNSHDLAKTHNTVHRTPFLGTTLIHHSHQREIFRGGRRTSSSASIDGGEKEEEYVNRINELNLNKINVEPQRNQEAEASTCSDESAPTKIESMPPESWPGSDGLVLQKTERMANSFDLPLSLRILKRKNDQLRQSAQMKDSACCSVKKAFSSTVLIVRELHSHLIRMREALLSPDNFQIQETLARVHGDLHASFVWLFHRIFSKTPTLMVYLMLLLANFTVFSITDHHTAAAPQALTVSIEESQNPSSGFSPPPIKTFSLCSSSAVGGSGGRGKPPAIASAADDGHSDRSSASPGEGATISAEVISMATMDEKKAATEWKKMVRETKEMIRANGRHEALMDPDTLRRLVSPVTAVAEPDDLSVYCGTELSYRTALAENPDNALLLSNFAQFLYTVHRDHERAEEYFRRAVRAEPAEAETLCRYASFLWVARKDLEAAEETFLEAISADPGNSHYSANYAHFLWSTGGGDTCYPLSDCDT